MASQSGRATTERAKVSQEALTVVMWTGVAISLCFVSFRAFARWKVFQRYFLDDAFVLLASLIFLANVILIQIMLPSVYEIIKVSNGVETKGLTAIPPDFQSTLDFYFHTFMPSQFAFWCSLWSVKASFLVFFRKLGDRVVWQDLIWYCATGMTAISFVILFSIWDYKCSVGDISIDTTCGKSPSSIRLDHAIFRATTALDVVSDCFILAIPINLVWRVQISPRQKLILGGILGLTFFIIAISIVRVATILALSRQLDLTWIFTWSVIEQTVAIVVACIASYRALFLKSQGVKRLHNFPEDTSQQHLKYDGHGRAIHLGEESAKSSMKSSV